MLTPQNESLPEIGEVPRYGCCTIRELDAIASCLPSDVFGDGDVVKAIAFTSHINTVLTAILLASRLQYWTYQETQLLSIATRKACSEFLINERNRWGNAPKRSGKGKPMSWEQVRYRLAIAFPGMAQWQDAARFMSLPIIEVEEAIAHLQDIELEREERAAMPVALLACLTASAHGVKNPDPQDFNPALRMRAKLEAKRTVDPDAAKLFMNLNQQGQIQPWVVGVSDMQTIRLAAED
ncbi:MAG: hypothetical protein AAFX78_04995 [Cyanobacteria bacterium J06638_20]